MYLKGMKGVSRYNFVVLEMKANDEVSQQH